MPGAWIMEELKTADLKDKRLDRRLHEVLAQLSERPTASIPAACGGHAERTGAYRLFDNPKASFGEILRPHGDATVLRLSAQAVGLLVQDTTEVEPVWPQLQVAGTGPLDGSRRGALMHLLHAFTPDGTPLGTLEGRAWARPEAAEQTPPTCARRAIPIEQKESFRWVQTVRGAGALAAACPQTHMVYLADSEADIYEVLEEGAALGAGIDWIVRGCYDRALASEAGREAGAEHVLEHLESQAVLFEKTVQIRARSKKVPCDQRGRRQPRTSRKARLSVRAAGGIVLRSPWRPKRRPAGVTINAVLVREVNPPGGEEPVAWLLLTSLPVSTAQQVRLVIQYYWVRWMIEVFFRVLKTGCRVEQRRFEHMDRLLSCLAVFLIVAWRTLYVCRLGRSCPQVSCEAVFEPAEWQSVWQVVRETAPPAAPPRLGKMVGFVAQLGGYVKGKRRGPPGPQTIWLGLQRMQDFARCWRLFGPAARAGPKDV